MNNHGIKSFAFPGDDSIFAEWRSFSRGISIVYIPDGITLPIITAIRGVKNDKNGHNS